MAEQPLFISTEYPYLPISITIGAFQTEALAYLDTGFDGFLAIPEELGSRLPLPEQMQRVGLASGDTVLAPVYLGSVQVAGDAQQSPSRIVLLGDEYLLGRRIIDRFRVTFDHGRQVLVEP
ncbi:MAG: hypothetical protein EXR50_02130 [Dehalococcoidia bacterium]|nr:hypothetical protein [Dehalococcoidia bacterium]